MIKKGFGSRSSIERLRLLRCSLNALCIRRVIRVRQLSLRSPSNFGSFILFWNHPPEHGLLWKLADVNLTIWLHKEHYVERPISVGAPDDTHTLEEE